MASAVCMKFWCGLGSSAGSLEGAGSGEKEGWEPSRGRQ